MTKRFFAINKKTRRKDGKMDKIFRKISSWVFLLGILISVIVGLVVAAGIWTANEYVTVLLALLGFIVGILTFFAVGNISHEKVPTFLIAALLIVGIGTFGNYFAELEVIGPYFANIAMMLGVFIAPAAGLLAIRAIWDAGKTEEIDIPKKLSK